MSRRRKNRQTDLDHCAHSPARALRSTSPVASARTGRTGCACRSTSKTLENKHFSAVSCHTPFYISGPPRRRLENVFEPPESILRSTRALSSRLAVLKHSGRRRRACACCMVQKLCTRVQRMWPSGAYTILKNFGSLVRVASTLLSSKGIFLCRSRPAQHRHYLAGVQHILPAGKPEHQAGSNGECEVFTHVRPPLSDFAAKTVANTVL